MITVKRKIQFARDATGRKRMVTRRRPSDEAVPGRVPRIARLMALAHRFDRLIRDGTVADQSELARLACVTQPRMTQIMNLLHLSPEIQEAVLLLPPTRRGRASITERDIRPIAAVALWEMQRTAWHALNSVTLNTNESTHSDPMRGAVRSQ